MGRGTLIGTMPLLSCLKHLSSPSSTSLRSHFRNRSFSNLSFQSH